MRAQQCLGVGLSCSGVELSALLNPPAAETASPIPIRAEGVCTYVPPFNMDAAAVSEFCCYYSTVAVEATTVVAAAMASTVIAVATANTAAATTVSSRLPC